MKFSEALIALDEGKRVRRRLWDTDHSYNMHVELIEIPWRTPEGRGFASLFWVWLEKYQVYRPFTGTAWDIHEAEDWEVVE